MSLNYIVIDLEWNGAMTNEQSDSRMPFEIIEIGALKLNDEFRMVSQFNTLIKPRKYKRLTSRTKEVTHLSENELNASGKDFKKTIKEFFKWCGDEYIFCTWGKTDLTELERNIRFHGLEIPFPKPLLYYDLQLWYSHLYHDGGKELKLEAAVDELGLSKRRPFHRAKDDAYYTTRVFLEMDFEQMKDCYSVDYYRLPKNKSEEVFVAFKDSAEFVSQTYPMKSDLLKDNTLFSTECWKCGKPLKKTIHWFMTKQQVRQQYFTLATCPVHGDMVGKIRFREAEGDKWFGIKKLDFAGEKGAEEVRLKQRERNRRRRQELRKQLKKLDVLEKEGRFRIEDGEVMVLNEEGLEKPFIGLKLSKRRLLNLKKKQETSEGVTWNVISRR